MFIIENTGRVTIPTDVGIINETVDIMNKWGADAVRDCDGTKLPKEIKNIAQKVYTTYFLTRNDQQWAKDHMDELQQLYLMSKYVMATDTKVDINIMDGYFEQQVKVDTVHEPKKWWEVIDRTTGNIVDTKNWDYKDNIVTINNAALYHEYTVNFLVYAIWDPTQMYNHITNDWGDREHEMPYDARKPKTQQHILDTLKKWLNENPDTDVVRFTTFFYHFTLVFNNLAKEKFVDWFGYSASVSPECLEEFEKEYGYKLRPEDIVDQGYYNSTFRVPTKQYKDFLNFQSKFVCDLAKKCVAMTHEKGKEAMMFLGDNWIGTEPYGQYFENVGLDAVVGSVGSGATLRLISDIPHLKYTEGRFLPYFFPDVFCEGGNPIKEAKENWVTARRAMLRNPVDRIGYGGYLKLALEFPDFIKYIEAVCNEFRILYDNIQKTKPYCAPFKVAVLNSWGKLRSWSTHMVAHALWYKQIYSYLGIIEALSGMAFDVQFISFDDIIDNENILNDFGVVINAGDAYTAFSGGEYWANEKIVTSIRKYVYNGGGFIGVGEPSAYQKDGKYFQLAAVLGVDKEIGFSISTRKYNKDQQQHFITDGISNIDFGEGMKNIYALEGTDVIINNNEDIQLASNSFGKGRSVYISGLPYNPQNARLLYRALFWAAQKENEINKWFAQNINVEVNAYPQTGKFCIVNNSYTPQQTKVFKGDGTVIDVDLAETELKWYDI